MSEIPTDRLRDPLSHPVSRRSAAAAWRLADGQDIRRLDGASGERILGVLRYAAGSDMPAPTPWPVCTIPLKTFHGDEASVVLLGRGPTESIAHRDVACRSDGETLFGVLVDAAAAGEQIETATYRIYRTLLRTTAELGFPHVCRIWNYVPDINAEPNGLEVYQAFSIGRRAALDDWGRIRDAALPAACAIGTRRPGLRVAFLASRLAVSTLSNIRQQEAYRYPPEYGPRSPAFSRAVLMNGSNGPLHISGTASIQGHRTVYEGDLCGQLGETLRNLDALLRPEGLSMRDAGPGTLLTVYLRASEHLPEAESLLAAALKPSVKRLFVQGEICRRSLLTEIEGIMTL